MNTSKMIEKLYELAQQLDDLRAEMPMDSKQAEQLADARYLVLDAVAEYED
jgi:hypothetical protein